MHRREIRLALLAGVLCALAWAPNASAQMPPDIAEKIKAIGRVVDPPKTAPIYAPLQQKEPYRDVLVTRDAKYGPDPRNALDFFVPEVADPSPRPVFIFVHGGGFVAGNKHVPGSPFYDNFGLWAASNGMIGVNVTYRLAPAHPWPAAIQDIAAAVKWVRANIAQYGGDPARIFLTGSSAGGGLVAGYMADPKLWPSPSDIGVKGVLLLAGVYDFTFMTPTPPLQAYLGKDASKYEERSPLKGMLKSSVPLFVAWGELDPPEIVKQSEILYANLCSKNRCPKKVWLPHHSHMSTVYAVNTGDTQLADAMLNFVVTTK
jgi:triacylglycerol lipase